jgi:putative ABC transport system ATP-binding protein
VAGAEVVDEFNLRGDIERVGLDHQVGPAGRLLTAQQRAIVNLIRCLVKRPDILVLDGALSSFGETRADELLRLVIGVTAGRSLSVVLPNERRAPLFGATIRFRGTQATLEAPEAAPTNQEPAPRHAAE